MKYQNFAIIFVLILLPISIVLSYYIQTQTDTLVLQTTYQTKLNDSTYDAIAAYQMNSLNTQRVSGESVKSYVLASVNTFFTTLATNLGMSSASKQMILPYVPAILFTTYDGYYIYSPTYTSKVATNPDDGVALTDKQKRVLYLKKGKNVDSSDFVSDGVNGKKFKEDYDSSKFTPDPDDPDVQYEISYMLKPFIYYSAQYHDKDNGKFNFTASYSLDNYITLYGEKDLSTREDTGSTVTKEFTKSGYLIDPTKISINGNLLLRVVKKNDGETGISMARPSNNGTYSYQAVIDANKNSNNNQHNNERFVTIPVNVANGQSSQGEDYYLINYFDYDKEKDFGDSYYCAKYRKDTINADSRDKMSIVRYQTGDEIIKETLDIEQLLDDQSADVNTYMLKSGSFSGISVTYNGVTIDDRDAKEYYIKAYYFSKWVERNLKDVKASSTVQIKDQAFEMTDQVDNAYAYADFTSDDSKIFDIEKRTDNLENDPESENSIFVKHKQDIIKNSIQYNLNLAISTYNENHNMDIASGISYKLPMLKSDDWNDILNNISMVSFMQGIPCGTTTFNNYAVIKSNNNNTAVSLENLYFTSKIGREEKSDSSYHKIDCSDLSDNNSTDIYEADQSAEFKYDAHKINTRIRGINDPTIICFYDDATNKYYMPKNVNTGADDQSSQFADDLYIGTEITDQAALANLINLPTGSEVKYIYDHQNEGCYNCIISGNYIPVVKYYDGDIYMVYKAENNDLVIYVNGKYLNFDGSEYVNPYNNTNVPTGGEYLINETEFNKRRKSMYTYLAKIRDNLYKTNDYVNR